MGKLDDLISAYVDALPIRPVVISAERDGKAARLGIGMVPEIFDALWFPKPQHAELVAMNCAGDFHALGAVTPEGFIDLAPSVVRDHVVNAAAMLGAIWRTDLEVRHDASFEVEKVIMAIEVSRRTGGLQDVNKAYKAQRLAGQTKISYAAHLAAFTRSLVMMAAKNIPT